MWYLISCRIKDNLKLPKELSVVPMNWVVDNVLYWPPNNKLAAATLKKNRGCVEPESDWIPYTNFKLLLNGYIFGRLNTSGNLCGFGCI